MLWGLGICTGGRAVELVLRRVRSGVKEWGGVRGWCRVFGGRESAGIVRVRLF